ncbi:MAG: hypothetical protein AMXMBFR56_03270 [Polyangiaceae bacterium]
MHRYAWLIAAGSALACTHHHTAPVHSAGLVPPPEPAVQHTGRLWIELEGTPDKQCERTPTERPLCFSRVHDALGNALERTLWPSFPGVAVKRKGDDIQPGDYLLHVRLRIDGKAPDASAPGWAAAVSGRWELVRDGLPLAGESLSSRSRGDFAYGRALGAGAGEAVDAVSMHIARAIGQLPELRPIANRPLPVVATRKQTGVLLRTSAAPTTDATTSR